MERANSNGGDSAAPVSSVAEKSIPRAGLSLYATRSRFEGCRSEAGNEVSRTRRCPPGVIVSSCIVRLLSVDRRISLFSVLDRRCRVNETRRPIHSTPGNGEPARNSRYYCRDARTPRLDDLHPKPESAAIIGATW